MDDDNLLPPEPGGGLTTTVSVLALIGTAVATALATSLTVMLGSAALALTAIVAAVCIEARAYNRWVDASHARYTGQIATVEAEIRRILDGNRG